MTPDTSRHTKATWMAQDGVPMWEIAGHLGHKDVMMVKKVYGHHRPEPLRHMSGAIGRMSSPIGNVQRRVKKARG